MKTSLEPTDSSFVIKTTLETPEFSLVLGGSSVLAMPARVSRG